MTKKTIIVCSLDAKNMKKIILLYAFTLVCAVQSYAQDTWVAFDEKIDNVTLTGFNDSKGKLRIAPIFTGFTVARKFDAIMGVMELENNRFTEPYYFTKKGKIIRDSVYVSDYQFDCESEGHIRFKDPKTGKIGMFNGNAKVVIPAVYSNLSPVHNGLMIAHKGAGKIVDGGNSGWIGGTKQIIDLNNKVLIDDLNYEGHLNLYSMQTSDTDGKEAGRHYFNGTDGKYYSFTDFNEDFKRWIVNNLAKQATKEFLLIVSNDVIRYPDEKNKWISEDKNTFVTRNYDVVLAVLKKLKYRPGYDVGPGFITTDMFPPDKYSMYYDNCNKIKYEQYPVMNIIIKNGNNALTDNLYFVYTGSGYKLIGMSVKDITVN